MIHKSATTQPGEHVALQANHKHGRGELPLDAWIRGPAPPISVTPMPVPGRVGTTADRQPGAPERKHPARERGRPG